jgi:2-dehydro-3-deoxygluconokinase
MLRIASIGECMIELRHRSAVDLELAFGGDTLNTAVYLARLTRGRNVEVDYVTALGDDAYSEQMLATWQAEGVGTDLVARLPGRRPGLYTIRTDPRGERSFTYWRSASAARHMLEEDRAERLAERLAGYDLLYLSGVTLSILDEAQRGALMALADAVRAAGGRVAFDTNYRPIGWPGRDQARAAFDAMARRVDIAMPTLDDDQALFGVADAAAAADRWHRLGAAEVAVKRDAYPCLLSSPGYTGDVPAEPVEQMVDSTAAGDSFNAAYLAARISGAEPPEAARLGHRLAARVISQPGAVIRAAAMADLIGSVGAAP